MFVNLGRMYAYGGTEKELFSDANYQLVYFESLPV